MILLQAARPGGTSYVSVIIMMIIIAVILVAYSQYKKKKAAEKNNYVPPVTNNPGDNQQANTPKVDVLGDIAKLKSLLDDGIITQEEFDDMKGKLIANK